MDHTAVGDLFDQIDLNQTGYVSRAEARRGLADLKVPYTSSQLDAFVRGLDHDNDGIISRAQFISFVLVRQEAMLNAFRQLDANADGKITRKDLRQVAERLGYQLSSQELDQVLAVAEGSEDGVSFEDFASNLLLVGDSHPEGTFEQWLAHSAVVLEADTVEVVAEGSADEAWWMAPTAGALAGMCSRTLTAPFDRLRTVLQAWDHPPAAGGAPSGGGPTGYRGQPGGAWGSGLQPAPAFASAARVAAEADGAPRRPEGAYSSHRIRTAVPHPAFETATGTTSGSNSSSSRARVSDKGPGMPGSKGSAPGPSPSQSHPPGQQHSSHHHSHGTGSRTHRGRPPALHLLNPVDRAIARGRVSQVPPSLAVPAYAHDAAISAATAQSEAYGTRERGRPTASGTSKGALLVREAGTSRLGGLAGDGLRLRGTQAGEAQLAWRGGVDVAGGASGRRLGGLGFEPAAPGYPGQGGSLLNGSHTGTGGARGAAAGDNFVRILRQLQLEAESGALSAIAVSRGGAAGRSSLPEGTQYGAGRGVQSVGGSGFGPGSIKRSGLRGMDWEIIFGDGAAGQEVHQQGRRHAGGGGSSYREQSRYSEQGHGHHRQDEWHARSSKEAARKAKRHGRTEGGTPWRTVPAGSRRTFDADAIAEREERRARRRAAKGGAPHLASSRLAAQAAGLAAAKAGGQEGTVAVQGLGRAAAATARGQVVAAAARAHAQTAASSASTGITDAAAWVYQQSGVRGFWRGNGVNVLKIAPETAVRLGCFEQLKGLVSADPDNIRPPERFLAGALAGVVSTLTIYPLEVIKTRLALSSSQQYANIVHMVLSVHQREGWRALYRGMGASIMGIVPYSGTELMIFSLLRDTWSARYPDREPGVGTLLMSGAAASACGQVVSYPLQLVRTRLQAQGMKGRPVLYKGVFDCFAKTLRADGVGGLYRGILPGFMKSIPSCMISFTVYDSARSQLRRMYPVAGSRGGKGYR